MKYYIPTSSLNLDTILQAESISPRSFYSQRKTGYKSIELIDEVKRFNSIVLFNHPVSFSIEDPGRYNYPLLIEIEDDSQLEDIHNINGTNLYFCAYTIYLTPQNSAFYFFADSAYKLTTINTKSNKSIKYYEKYKIFPSASLLKLKPLKIEENITEPIDSCISNETAIDKQKGVLYSFLMGQLLSLTPELAHQQRLSQELYNILTGIISNPQMKDNFQYKLEPLLQEFKSIDPFEVKNKEKFEEKLKAELGRFRFLKHCLIDILEKWEVWSYVVARLSNKWECNWLPNITDVSSTQDFIELRNEIEIRTNDALVQHRKKQPIPSVENVFKNDDIFQIKDMPIISKVIDYIIQNQLTADSLTSNRQNICKELIKDIVIEEIKNTKGGDYWENSSEQRYFNHLYVHIGDLGKPFDLKSIDNPEMLAIASFLLRGQDINGLLAYLKSNEICDYRYPLVLWGALCGYMEMNKESLLEILTLENYQNVYECLFHKPIGELKHYYNDPLSPVNSNKGDYLKILEIIGLKEKIFNALSKSLNTCKNQDIQSCIVSTLESKECKRSTKQCELALSSYQLLLVRNDEKTFKSILTNMDVTEKVRKEVLLQLGFSNLQSKRPNQEAITPNKEKYQQNAESSFFNYIQGSKNVIEKLSCFQGINKDIITRLEDNWSYVLSQKDNKTEIINYFLNICKKEGEGRTRKRTPLLGFFTEEVANKCKKELELIYEQ